MQSPSGIVLVDKPAGVSSFKMVAELRAVLSRDAGKRIKVGHTGTLDPFATGLMILVVGSYTKRAAEFSKLDKTYVATMCLGQTSTTGDPEGELTDVSDKQPTEQELKEVLKQFVGQIQQTPPAHSAIKIDGQRAYKLARAGKTVDMPTRSVIIHKLELLEYNYPEAKISCDVSSGTYVRSLVQDIGAKLGTGAYTSALRRTAVGEYSIDQVSPDIHIL